MGQVVKVSRKPVEKPVMSFYKKMLKNWYLFAISIFLCLSGVTALNNFTVPEYRIGAKVLIKQEGRAGMYASGGSDEIDAINAFQQSYSAYNEMYVLQSADIVEKTIRNLNFNVSYYSKNDMVTRELYKNSPFVVVYDPSFPQPVDVKFSLKFINKNTFTLEIDEKDVEVYSFKDEKSHFYLPRLFFSEDVKIGQELKTEFCNFKILLNNDYSEEELLNSKFYFSFHSLPSLISQYTGSISTNITSQWASVVVIDVTTRNIDKGIDFLNELMNQYMKENLDKKNHYANITLEYINGQLGKISDTLSQTSRIMQEYRATHQVIDIPTKIESLNLQLQTLEGQKNEVETRYRYYKFINDYLTEDKNISDLIAPSSMGIEETLLNTLIQELITLNAEKKSLIDNKQEKNPYLKTIEIKIENNKKTILENIKYSLNTTRLTLRDLDERISQIRFDIRQLPTNERELADIQRKHNINDAVLTSLMARQAEAQIARASNLPDNSIIEKARMVGDSPVSPKRKANLVVGLLLGLIIPVGVILYKDANQEKIVEESEISKYTDFSIIGTILHNETKSSLFMSEFPQSGIAESIRLIRSNIQYYSRSEDSQVVLLTSTVGHEGKSMTSVSLAMACGLNNQRTILVSFDLRKPVLNDYLKVNSSLGLSSYLINAATLDDIIVKTEYPNLDYIASGDIPPNPSELIACPQTKVLLNDLREMYDYIIIDTAPLGLVSDTLHLLNQSDVNLYLVRQNVTPKYLFINIMNELVNKQINNMAIVLNDFTAAKNNYGYKYGYYQKSKKKKSIKKKIKNATNKTVSV